MSKILVVTNRWVSLCMCYEQEREMQLKNRYKCKANFKALLRCECTCYVISTQYLSHSRASLLRLYALTSAFLSSRESVSEWVQ